LFIFMFGRNIAWTYEGEFDAFFHGNIKLTYCVPWWILGMVVEYVFEPVLVSSAEKLLPHFEAALFSAICFTLFSIKFLHWPLFGLPKLKMK